MTSRLLVLRARSISWSTSTRPAARVQVVNLVTSVLLAITGRMIAVYRGSGSSLSCRLAVSGGTAAVFRPLQPGARHRARVTHRGGLVAGQRRQISIARDAITSGGRVDTPLAAAIAKLAAAIAKLAAAIAKLAAAIAKLAAEVMHARVAAVHEVAIAGRLIGIGRGLVAISRSLIAIGSGVIAIGRGLIAIGRGLVGIRGGLISIRERLIALERARRRDDLLIVLDRPVRGIHGMIA